MNNKQLIEEKKHAHKFKGATSESGTLVANGFVRFASITILFCECGEIKKIRDYFKADGEWRSHE